MCSSDLRVVDGMVEVDLEPPASLLRATWDDLARALARQETGRAARGAVRLVDLGVPPAEIAAFSATHDARYRDYGPSHALALAQEVVAHVPAGVEPLLPVVQALDLAARSTLGMSLRPVPEAIDPGDDPVAAGARLRAMVEAEDHAAEALMRGAVARGWGRAEIEPWLFALCADHFLDFGHALIYSTKVFDLIDAGAPAADLLGALVWGIVTGTREDLLPAWAGWRKHVAERTGRPVGAPLPLDTFVDLDPHPAFARALEGDPLDALSIAAAERILRFDLAIDRDPNLAEGWLDVSHRLTFVDAVRRARARWDHPDADRLVLQAVWFVAMARPLDGPRAEERVGSREELLSGIAARQVESWTVARPHLDADLVDALETEAWKDGATRAIFLAHLVKTLRAGAAERTATGDDRPLLAAIRLLGAPIRERNVERTVVDAINLVRHGRPPKSLTG